MLSRLRAIPDLHIVENASLADYTRFALGGRARAIVDASTEDALIAAIRELRGTPWTLVGGGSNLVAADEGFSGIVLRYSGCRREFEGTVVLAEAGVVLQDLVDESVARGLQGFETMTGIPGWVGGAVYGNAGAYGRSIHELAKSVRYWDGTTIREISNLECRFGYRESVFKQRKDWIVLGATFQTKPFEAAELKATADGILKIRNEKYPPALRCAGSIFKNLILDELPEAVRAQIPQRVIREGKVPSAYVLEEVGGKGMILGGIRVADYHANLLYNHQNGTAAQVRELIGVLKSRVRDRFGIVLEEEVQYLGESPADGMGL